MTNVLIDYSVERDGDTLTVHVSGLLNAATAPDLEAAINKEIEGVTELVIDCEGLENISSMGLRLLLALYKRMEKQGSMLVVNTNGSVRNVLDMTGFSAIYGIEE